MKFFDRYFGWVLLILAGFLLALLAWVLLDAYQESKLPTFTLTKADWVCTDHRIVLIPQTQVVGKAVVVTQLVTDECSQWSRR